MKLERWHKDHCQNPVIILSNSSSTIQCKSCSAETRTVSDAAQNLNLNLDHRSPPRRAENQPLKWPSKARYLGEFSSAVEVTSSPSSSKIPRVAPTSTSASASGSASGSSSVPNEAVRPEILFDDEIRLVQFSSYDDLNLNLNGPVHLTWETTHLREQPQAYNTVCYTTVGEELSWKPVYIGPFWDILYVHRNCESALRKIRNLLEDRTLFLWVDEICIDMDDISERNHQTSLSREIQTNARNVFAFLADSSNEMELVSNSLEEGKVNGHGVVENVSSEAENAWTCFSRLPIFSRVWILQELLLARGKVVFITSSGYPLTWPTGIKVPGILDCIRDSILHRMIESKNIRHCDFLDLLQIASQYECSDPRDKIFGILGLANESIRPNYSLSVEDIFTGIAAYLATYLVDMRILKMAGLGRSTLDIPSWVPDWTQKAILEFPSSENSINDSGLRMDGFVPFSFHGMVSNNIEILVDPKLRGLQCSAIKLCSYNDRWQTARHSLLSERLGILRRAVFPRDKQGNLMTDHLRIREFLRSTSENTSENIHENVSVFLIQGLNDPVLLRYCPEKETYSLLTTCVVLIRVPESGSLPGLPWDASSESSNSSETLPERLDIYRLTAEEKQGISEFDSTVLDVIRHHQHDGITTNNNPDNHTFKSSMLRFFDIVKFSFSDLREIEKNLRKTWKNHEQNLGWMFRDHKKLWAFVEYLEEEYDGDTRGTGKMQIPDHRPTTSTTSTNDTERTSDQQRSSPHYWQSFSTFNLPSKYTWDLGRFCLSFVSGSSTPPRGSEDAEPGDLVAHISDIRSWAETTERLLRIMAYTEKHLCSKWEAFPGNDMMRTWLAPFETGVWKWDRFRASLLSRERILDMGVPDNLDPRVNYNVKLRLVMGHVGMEEEERQIMIV